MRAVAVVNKRPRKNIARLRVLLMIIAARDEMRCDFESLLKIRAMPTLSRNSFVSDFVDTILDTWHALKLCGCTRWAKLPILDLQ
jgi:hypothetical protein